MKTKIVAALLMSFLSGIIYSQTVEAEFKVGDTYTIGEVHNNNYKHINFPRPNFIIKKGGIATYKNIVGKRVEVTSVNVAKDGSKSAIIKLSTKGSFFNSHKYLSVAMYDAVATKELIAETP